MRPTPQLTLVTAPSLEPVLLTDAKSQCRITTTEEDTLIGTYITSARELVEGYLNRSLITQTWQADYDDWYAPFMLPRPPLQSVSSIQYYDLDNVLQTLDPSLYIVTGANSTGFGKIAPSWGAVWPPVYPRFDSVQIKYVAGYGNASAVPADIRIGILMYVGHLYENREITTPLDIRNLPKSIDALLLPNAMPK